MNSFGKIFQVQVFGESHGAMIGVTISGVPPGIPLSLSDFEKDLERRKGGILKGTTPRKEEDLPIIVSGWFNEHTTGSPLSILFENKNTRSGDYQKHRDIPRPGHADFVAHQKFNGFEDYRGGGHFSARLTVGIVAAGVLAKKIISFANIQAEVVEVAGEKNIEQGLQKGIDAKDSVGGIINCTVDGLPIGLGEPFWDSTESLLAHALFAIPAVKGVEFGVGFKAATMFGSEHNDSLIAVGGATKTNHAGGIVGGITNGNQLNFNLAIKPTASTPKEQVSMNTTTETIEAFSVKGRHDLCVALRAPVIVEAVTAIVLADLWMCYRGINTNHLNS